jgi:hypothetical protein
VTTFLDSSWIEVLSHAIRNVEDALVLSMQVDVKMEYTRKVPAAGGDGAGRVALCLPGSRPYQRANRCIM